MTELLRIVNGLPANLNTAAAFHLLGDAMQDRVTAAGWHAAGKPETAEEYEESSNARILRAMALLK